MRLSLVFFTPFMLLMSGCLAGTTNQPNEMPSPLGAREKDYLNWTADLRGPWAIAIYFTSDAPTECAVHHAGTGLMTGAGPTHWMGLIDRSAGTITEAYGERYYLPYAYAEGHADTRDPALYSGQWAFESSLVAPVADGEHLIVLAARDFEQATAEHAAPVPADQTVMLSMSCQTRIAITGFRASQSFVLFSQENLSGHLGLGAARGGSAHAGAVIDFHVADAEYGVVALSTSDGVVAANVETPSATTAWRGVAGSSNLFIEDTAGNYHIDAQWLGAVDSNLIGLIASLRDYESLDAIAAREPPSPH